MRSEKEMMHLIFEVAKKLQVVEAIALNGSKVYRKTNTDDFQDFDVVYFVKEEEMENLITNRTWLEDFGEILVMQTPMIEEGVPYHYSERFNFLMLFKDGNRIDLGLCPVPKISQWAKEDPVAEILDDPKGLLGKETLYQDEAIYYVQKPSQQKFQEVCNEFWWVSPYVVKGILREEFFYALDHFNHLQGCFLELLSWYLASDDNYQITLGKNYKYLKNYLREEEMAKILSWQNNGDYPHLARHFLKLQEAFQQLAKLYSDKEKYSYHQKEAENVLAYTKRKLEEVK